jgi:hypothetical protein
MPRAPLPIGTWGAISTWVVQTDDKGKAVKHKSQARFRDHDGQLRPVSACGKTKTAAERALLKKLQDRAKTNQSGEFTAMHKISHLIDLWENKFEERIRDGKRSPTSLETYTGCWETIVIWTPQTSEPARPGHTAHRTPSVENRVANPECLPTPARPRTSPHVPADEFEQLLDRACSGWRPRSCPAPLLVRWKQSSVICLVLTSIRIHDPDDRAQLPIEEPGWRNPGPEERHRHG